MIILRLSAYSSLVLDNKTSKTCDVTLDTLFMHVWYEYFQRRLYNHGLKQGLRVDLQ